MRVQQSLGQLLSLIACQVLHACGDCKKRLQLEASPVGEAPKDEEWSRRILKPVMIGHYCASFPVEQACESTVSKSFWVYAETDRLMARTQLCPTVDHPLLAKVERVERRRHAGQTRFVKQHFRSPLANQHHFVHAFLHFICLLLFDSLEYSLVDHHIDRVCPLQLV